MEPGLLPTFPLGFYRFTAKITEGFPDRPSTKLAFAKLDAQVMEMIKLRKKLKVNRNNTSNLL